MRELKLEDLANHLRAEFVRSGIEDKTMMVGFLAKKTGVEGSTIRRVFDDKGIFPGNFGKICYGIGKQPMEYFSIQRRYKSGEVNIDKFSNDILLYLGNPENNIKTVKDLAYKISIDAREISLLFSGKKMCEFDVLKFNIDNYEMLAKYIGIEDGLEHYKVTEKEKPKDPLFEGVQAYATILGYVIGKPQDGVNGTQVVLDAAYRTPSETVNCAARVLGSNRVVAFQSIYKGASHREALEDGVNVNPIQRPTSLS
jgi:hypothetical protein